VIGKALDERVYRVTWGDEVLVDCPVDALTTGRRVERPARRRAPSAPWRVRTEDAAGDLHEALLRLLGSWNGCSREYLFRHYDPEVQGRTWLRPGESDATVIRVDRTRGLGVALGVGGNPFWCASDPELGARHAVAEAARNVACAGGRPWALTDCLNFGAPEDPEVMGDFVATLEGLAVAAEALGRLAGAGDPLPYVSGNVSLYNQAAEHAVPPSPIVLCAGVLGDVTTAVGIGLRRAGDFLVLVGEPRDELTGSLYAREIAGRRDTAPPTLDLTHEARLQELAVVAAEGRWVRAAHDISDGGLALALVEMMLAAPDVPALGAQVDLGALEAGDVEALFSERSAIVFEVAPERSAALFQAARERSLLAWPIGTVGARAELKVLRSQGSELFWTKEDLSRAVERPLAALWNEEES